VTWVKIDDHANEHEKQVEAGGDACWLWACGLMYCNRQKKKTGIIPAAQVRGLYVGFSDAQSARLAKELVRVRLWEVVEGGFQVHDYGDYQPTTLSEIRAAVGSLGGKRSGEVRRSKDEPIGSKQTGGSNEPIGSHSLEPNALARARVGTGSGSDLSEARRDPDPDSQRAPAPARPREDHTDQQDHGGLPPVAAMPRQETTATSSDATPEQPATAPAEPLPPETSYDLARRVWSELWRGKYHRPYTFSPNLGPKSEHSTLRWLGDLGRERGGAEAERWVRHWVAAYLRDHGKGGQLDDQCHPLRWIESAVNSAGEPKRPTAKRIPREPAEPPLPPLHVDPRKAAAAFQKAIADGTFMKPIASGGAK